MPDFGCDDGQPLIKWTFALKCIAGVFQEAFQGGNRTERDEADSVLELHNLHFVAGLQGKAFPNSFWNGDLKFG